MRCVRGAWGARMGMLTAIVMAIVVAAGAARAQAVVPAHGIAPAAVVDDTIRCVTPTGTLVGSLMRPRDVRGAMPVVLIHPGSGPTTRDGNSAMLPGRNESLRQLAESLAVHGIASVRIDKRGVGASAAALQVPPDSLRFDVFVEDVRAWVRLLAADARFDRIVLLGHSEGALVVSLAAAGVPKVAGVVTVAGMGRPLGAVLREQLGDPQRLPAAMFPAVDSAVTALETGRPLPASLPPVLRQGLFPPSVEAYLRSVVTRDPVAAVAALRVPVLVVQGTTDVQVSVGDARALAGARASGVELVVVEGVNHVLKRVGGPLAAQLESYGSATPATDGGVVGAVVGFVGRVGRVGR